jgi:hypothetical protein
LDGECHFWKHIVGQIYQKDLTLVIVVRIKRKVTTTMKEASSWEHLTDIFLALLVCSRALNPIYALVTAVI